MPQNIARWIKKYKIEIVLFLLSFFVQLIPFFIWLVFHPDLLFEDKELYWSMAKNIINHGSFSTFIYSEPDATRVPAYPLFLGLLYLILFKSMAAVLFIQNIIGAATTILVYRLGKKIFNAKIGLFASILYLFEAEHLGLSSLIRSEILFTFFFLLSILYFLEYVKSFHAKHLIYSSLFLGIATLTRPNSQMFFAIYIFIFLLMAIAKKISFKKFLLNSVLMAAIIAATLLPWSARNYIRLGTAQISPIFGVNLYYNLVLEAKNMVLQKQSVSDKELYAIAVKRSELLAKELGVPRRKYSSVELQKYWLDKSLTEIKKDPLLYINTFFGCKITYLFNDASAYFLSIVDRGYDNPVIHIPNFLLFPVLYYGMKFVWIFIWLIISIGLIMEFIAYFWRRKKDIPWIMYIFLLSSVAYFAMLTFCAGPLTRYRFPTNPLIFALFAHFLYSLAGETRKKIHSRKIN